MATKYPIVLVHGVMLKDVYGMKAFGKIESEMEKHGYDVRTSDQDAMGTVAHNAAQLHRYLHFVLSDTGAEKLNLIAHSKGGLDILYMIHEYGMADKIASITFVSTPHKGANMAKWLYNLPRPLRGLIVVAYNISYRILRDEKPDALELCRELIRDPNGIEVMRGIPAPEGIYMQSFSSTLYRSRDDFLMGIPLKIARCYEKIPCDGMVSAESATYANYRGDCTELSVSHSSVVDFFAHPKVRRGVLDFYIRVADELAEWGY